MRIRQPYHITQTILSILKSQYYDYAVRWQIELQFGSTAKTVFEEYQERVDGYYSQLPTTTLQKLNAIEDLLDDGNPERYAQVLTSCRRLWSETAKTLFDEVLPGYTGNIFKTKSGKDIDISGDHYNNKLSGHNYIYQIDDEDNIDRGVQRINKNKTDASLRRLRNAITAICDELEKVYKGNYNLYSLIDEEDIFCGNLQLEDGDIHMLRAARNRIAKLETMLQTQNDDLDYVPPKEMITLSDLGYKAVMNRTPFYEKTLEDSDEQEVVEEILVTSSGDYLRRKRIIIWDNTTYGRSSKSIKYKNLSIGKKLYKTIQNTLLTGWKYASISKG